MKKNRIFIYLIALILVLLTTIVYQYKKEERLADMHQPPQWRKAAIAAQKQNAKEKGYEIDDFTRLISWPNKRQILCPHQTSDTLVGQSNITNFHQEKYESQHGDKVVNFYDGKCYQAASPLIGGNGTTGESLTLMSNLLMKTGKYDQIVIVPAAMGGTKADLWAHGELANKMLIKSLNDVGKTYQVTHVIWQQGEADLGAGTSRENYKSAFYSMLATIRNKQVMAPVFVSIGTRCSFDEKINVKDNLIAEALKSLPNISEGIWLGVDTDELIDENDRYDRCHFNKSGQEKFATAYAKVIQVHKGQRYH